MSVRVVAALWLVLGVVIWNGFYDLHVSRGAREYLQLRADHEAGRGPEPDMQQVMGRSKRAGVRASTAWATLVILSGWGTLWIARRAHRDRQ